MKSPGTIDVIGNGKWAIPRCFRWVAKNRRPAALTPQFDDPAYVALCALRIEGWQWRREGRRRGFLHASCG